jgi:hypothetical protein
MWFGAGYEIKMHFFLNFTPTSSWFTPPPPPLSHRIYEFGYWISAFPKVFAYSVVL